MVLCNAYWSGWLPKMIANSLPSISYACLLCPSPNDYCICQFPSCPKCQFIPQPHMLLISIFTLIQSLPPIESTVHGILKQIVVDSFAIFHVNCWVLMIHWGSHMPIKSVNRGRGHFLSTRRLPPPIWPHQTTLLYHYHRCGWPGVVEKPSGLKKWMAMGDFGCIICSKIDALVMRDFAEPVSAAKVIRGNQTVIWMV